MSFVVQSIKEVQLKQNYIQINEYNFCKSSYMTFFFSMNYQ